MIDAQKEDLDTPTMFIIPPDDIYAAFGMNAKLSVFLPRGKSVENGLPPEMIAAAYCIKRIMTEPDYRDAVMDEMTEEGFFGG